VEEVYDDAVTELAAAAAATRVGPDGDYGALISAAQVERVDSVVGRRGRHTELVTGGCRIDRPGYYYAPTVVAGVRPDDELAQDEVFGPVVSVERARDEEHAIELANGTRFGLGASVWTTDHAAALRVSRRLTAGDVWINVHGFQVSEMPHGGFRRSGHGSDLSVHALLDYTRPVHVASKWA
jgi:betaine-aldehyde dehydrogenase